MQCLGQRVVKGLFTVIQCSERWRGICTVLGVVSGGGGYAVFRAESGKGVIHSNSV